jgi:hypothetical protein
MHIYHFAWSTNTDYASKVGVCVCVCVCAEYSVEEAWKS